MTWSLCKAILGEVSRTFAVPIGMLREPLERAVTVGYLLCRVVDTVEDEPDLPLPLRDALYAAFLGVVERGLPAEGFVALFDEAVPREPGEVADRRLARALPAVMDVFEALPDAARAPLRRWVTEMARGMAIYSRRPAGPDGVVAVTTLADLERYCYFVAGTVGHLLTELFLDALPDLDDDRYVTLVTHAEQFGLGLQLVNIVKDITDDLERGVAFVPRAACAAQRLQPADLVDPARRDAAHAAVAPVLARAERALAGAVAYTLAVPPDATDVRMFCLLPLALAVATLDLARGNDALFTPGAPVKISREAVAATVSRCAAICGDDDAVRAAFLAPLSAAAAPAAGAAALELAG
ncbi:MAG: squalene/phytoene synthase family protein [Deltaproteobacteria bacterium]|nr:squalene/phytoene synthase family protein [Deltaproteobacteria bacterium]